MLALSILNESKYTHLWIERHLVKHIKYLTADISEPGLILEEKINVYKYKVKALRITGDSYKISLPFIKVMVTSYWLEGDKLFPFTLLLGTVY